MDSGFPPRASDYVLFPPTFRISTYSELQGALGNAPPTQVTGASAVQVCRDVSEPPELAMYTVGVYDNYDIEPVGSAAHGQYNTPHQRNGSILLGYHSDSSSDPTHDIGYGIRLFYDYAEHNRDLDGPSQCRDQSPITDNRPPSHVTAAACEDESVRLYHITEAGNLCSATVPVASPAASDTSSNPIENVVEERVEVKTEPSATPEPFLSPLSTSAPSTPPSTPEEDSVDRPTRSTTKTKVKKRIRPTTPLACYYCRKRKIRCGGPDEHDETRRCKQCQHRKQECQFPPRSNRGRRPNPESKSALKKARKSSAMSHVA
ncbi:hypothetical protein NM688_g8074 [Phlebia brevispora]|uniref:Uncharacterized protein n=1 Tax=Phlebia brevispora TaxID=194682 RepID=A0ACC1RY53_9APHY|nr:hypothetical protein NM688_g8074 [Phlebia brevispora]